MVCQNLAVARTNYRENIMVHGLSKSIFRFDIFEKTWSCIVCQNEADSMFTTHATCYERPWL